MTYTANPTSPNPASNVILAKHLSAAVPRYTSYPTAPHFHDGIDEQHYRTWLTELPADDPVSVYIHIPFCDRLCWFCGCHTKQIARYDPIPVYLKAVHKEISLLASAIGNTLRAGKPLRIGRLHLGGGSPSLLRQGDLLQLRQALEASFHFQPDVEISLEIDPSDMTDEGFTAFRQFGMTRASIGVQDFDERVQKAINRPQSFEQTACAVDTLRNEGVASLNIDALYGLPFQTVKTVARSIEQVASLAPDRIALFGYAHVPWIKTHQKMIPENALPGHQDRLHQARMAEEILLGCGYQKIGIDHFALPGDSLAIAAQTGTLRRNFQGYTADDCQTLLGLGASSIGKLPNGYIQNQTPTGIYMSQVSHGMLPVARGFCLTGDDRLYGDVIEQLMCRFRFSLTNLTEKHGVRAETLRHRIDSLILADGDHLTEFDGDIFTIRPAARAYTRVVASWFDARLQDSTTRYSAAV